MISIQTNIDSLVAQQNLSVNSQFQSNTIQQLTSGYRINSSADDAAGLAVANGYRNQIAELNQGVLNANQGVSQLQIIDGGLSNISQILDRMKTLATESASSTFTGDRTTLNNEFQTLVGEVNRQASNVGLSQSVTTNNAILSVYIGGGGKTQSNSQVNVDLSGAGNRVDSLGLGLSNQTLLAAGTDMGTATLNSGSNVLASANATYGDQQTFTVNLAGGNTVTATIKSAGVAGISVSDAISQLNNSLSSYGISASVDSATGHLMLSGTSAFTVSASAIDTNTSTGTDSTNADGLATSLVASTDTAVNGALYSVDQGQGTAANKPVTSFAGVQGTDQETLTFASGSNAVTVNLTATNAGSLATALQTLNTSLSALGISAVKGTGGDIEFQSASNFTIAKAGTGAAGTKASGEGAGVFAASDSGDGNANLAITSETPSVAGSSTGNALTAVTAVTNAVASLGLVQGRVGAGENMLNYAINLAQSQITSFSSAQSQIRDANVAAEAANMTKAQVLQQASIAAMAQANAEPQAVLTLLKG